ncbi:DUF885 domain-containing protein [Flavobacteriaceae bacterium]|nr:DUF885 domain-containing protein [Flavobacteriaceae bacterium]MDC1460601.1 DUF885 domain-containing protein [Flavobacteriaceae bacterium]
MKRLAYIFVCLVLSIGCSSIAEDEIMLQECIDQYEAYDSYDREIFPLGDHTEERYQADYDFYGTLLEKINGITVAKLTSEDRISLKLLKFLVEDHRANFEFQTHLNPLLSDSGFHNSLVYRVRPLTSKKQSIAYLKMLQAIPIFVDQNLILLKKGLESGVSQPLIIFDGYESSYDKHITETVENNFYFSPFKNLPDQFSSEEKDSLLSVAYATIQKDVIPSFQKIKTFFETEYYPQTRKAIGVSQTPNGSAFYKDRIAYYTTLDMTAEEVHQLGLKEVAKIKNAMEAIITEVEFQGSFEDFFAFLRSDKQFYAQSGDELLMRARDIAKRLDEQLPKFFKTLPRTPYGVAAVPDAIAPKYTGGRYIPTRPNSTNPGYYWVNTYNLPSRPLYVLPALTAHEAVPGHHLQMALNSELSTEIPSFRRSLYLSAYGEGWGLYTEALAGEMGIYTTPYERFGQLTYSMWRACRLVVDTGIHAFGWSKEQAVEFMTANTALSFHEINTEVDRYISWPGQALAYKVGELKISELRQKTENALGDQFDIREFHNSILQKGTLTLPLMEEEIASYIKQELNE